MSIRKIKGIVIRSYKHNDDIFITLLSEKISSMDFVLKGIIKSKRRPVAGGEPGSLIELDYYDGNSGVFSVKEFSLLERHDTLKSNYGGYLIILYFTEMVNSLVPPGEPGGKIYQLLYKYLDELNNGNYHALILPSFKIKLLYFLGLIPRVFLCNSCGKRIIESDTAQINPTNFDIYCGQCMNGKFESRSIIGFLQKLLHETYVNMFATDTDIEIIKMSDDLLNQYLMNYLGKELKSTREFYQHIGAEYEFNGLHFSSY